MVIVFDCLTTKYYDSYDKIRAWIFILEGLVTVIAGLLSFYILQDYPETARFLSEPERKLATRRLREDGQSSNTSEKFHWSEVKKSFTDWKTWVGILCHISTSRCQH